MNCCSHVQDTGEFFSTKTAAKELRRYRKSGPPASTTRMLVDALRERALSGKTLLDIGGGVGAVSFELMDDGIAHATLVEVSKPYLAAASEEAKRRNAKDRISFRYGDYVERAPEIGSADVVVLDRVICCYPHMEQLVEASTEHTNRWYGVVYPKDRWYIEAGLKLVNLYCRLRSLDFRVYRHAGVDAAIRRQGFRPVHERDTLLWNVAVYERTNGIA